VKINYIVKW